MTGNRHIGGLALLLALAACETGTEPGDPTGFDADRVVANHEAFDRIVTSDGLESFEAAAASFQTEAPEVLAAFDAVSTRAGALDLAQRLAMAGGTAARVPVISESNRGGDVGLRSGGGGVPAGSGADRRAGQRDPLHPV